jgi:hypothetical protein
VVGHPLHGNAPAAAGHVRDGAGAERTIPTACNQRGVVVLTYPTDGIQNGPNDGVALVNATGTVIELLSYEGVFTASNGPAAGMTSVNVGVSEISTTPVGSSLQRNADGHVDRSPAANTFGACNDGDENPGATPTVATVTVAPTIDTVVVGATTPFTATALDAADAPIAGVALTWSSSDEAIATVLEQRCRHRRGARRRDHLGDGRQRGARDGDGAGHRSPRAAGRRALLRTPLRQLRHRPQ